MCYVVHILTDAPDDLAAQSGTLIHFTRSNAAGLGETLVGGADLVALPTVWSVTSQWDCACTLRHVFANGQEMTPDDALWFGPPVEWYDEEPEELEATRELHAVLRGLTRAGHRVEVLDHSHGDRAADLHTLDVDLEDVDADSFRLFSGYRFRLARRAAPAPGDAPRCAGQG